MAGVTIDVETLKLKRAEKRIARSARRGSSFSVSKGASGVLIIPAAKSYTRRHENGTTGEGYASTARPRSVKSSTCFVCRL
jgi:hypothetical protein